MSDERTKILIVDDERNIREAIARYLALEGIEAHRAANGLAAQRLLSTESYAAAVVDLRMPEMGGLELLGWLRSEGLDTPVVMISAFGEIGDTSEANRLGAEDYIVKPFDPADLVVRLKKIIEDKKKG